MHSKFLVNDAKKLQGGIIAEARAAVSECIVLDFEFYVVGTTSVAMSCLELVGWHRRRDREPNNI